MSIRASVQRLVAQKSGNRCAFPECRRVLTIVDATSGDIVLLGDIAHIVAESPLGPRGEGALTSAERNAEPNLLLLCNRHHQLVDSAPQTYPVERLKAFKADHEAWVAARLGPAEGDGTPSAEVTQTLHSTLLAVEHMPTYVYSAPCSADDEEHAKPRIRWDGMGREFMAPFIIRGNQLHAFQDLRNPGPFEQLIDARYVQRSTVGEWWDDPDRLQWFATLLNRSLNKLTGRLGLRLDSEHHRFYFPALDKGVAREIQYRPLNQGTSTRNVVWEPKSKKTGAGRGYWYHLAVNLRFHKVAVRQWVLAMRPELRITLDGFEPYPADKVGAKVTRMMAKVFNYDLLGDLNFWRDFLSGGTPRIVFPFDRNQVLSVSSTLLSAPITWPGLPPEKAKPFRNVEYDDDLLSWAGLERYFDETEDDELNDESADHNSPDEGDDA